MMMMVMKVSPVLWSLRLLITMMAWGNYEYYKACLKYTEDRRCTYKRNNVAVRVNTVAVEKQ